MSQRVLLVHGWGGSDFPHWQSWLASEIAKEYGTVQFLHFTNVDTPKLDVWSAELLEALESFKPGIVICHSLANTLWFHLCNTTALSEIQKLYLVAPPSMQCKVPELAEFFPVQTPTQLYSKESLLISSTNDPYISMNEIKSLKKELGIEMKVLENAGHINVESGYGEWPWILESLQGKSS